MSPPPSTSACSSSRGNEASNASAPPSPRKFRVESRSASWTIAAPTKGYLYRRTPPQQTPRSRGPTRARGVTTTRATGNGTPPRIPRRPRRRQRRYPSSRPLQPSRRLRVPYPYRGAAAGCPGSTPRPFLPSARAFPPRARTPRRLRRPSPRHTRPGRWRSALCPAPASPPRWPWRRREYPRRQPRGFDLNRRFDPCLRGPPRSRWPRRTRRRGSSRRRRPRRYRTG